MEVAHTIGNSFLKYQFQQGYFPKYNFNAYGYYSRAGYFMAGVWQLNGRVRSNKITISYADAASSATAIQGFGII